MRRFVWLALVGCGASTDPSPPRPVAATPAPQVRHTPPDARLAAVLDAAPPAAPAYATVACPATDLVSVWWRHELWPGCAPMPFANHRLPDLPARCAECAHPCGTSGDGGPAFAIDYDEHGRWWRTWNSSYMDECTFEGDHRTRCSISIKQSEYLVETATRDDRGRIVEIASTVKDKSEEPIRIAYDDSGNVARVTRGDQRVAFEYDTQQRLVSERAGRERTATTYRYDDAGRLVLRRDPENETTYHYDRGGRLDTIDGRPLPDVKRPIWMRIEFHGDRYHVGARLTKAGADVVNDISFEPDCPR